MPDHNTKYTSFGSQINLQIKSSLAKEVTVDSEVATNSRTLHTLNVSKHKNINEVAMDTDDVKSEVIKDSLKKIIAYTIWIGGIDLVLFIGLSQKHDNIGIGQFNLPIRYVAISILISLIFFSFSVLDKFDRILCLYTTIEDSIKKENIKKYLNLHPSIINPFAENPDNEKSVFFDNLGLGIQALFILVGVFLSTKYLFLGVNTVLVYIVLFIILLLVRWDLILIEKEIKCLVSEKSMKFKNIFTYFFISVYCILVFIF